MKKLSKKDIDDIFTVFFKHNPEPKIELEYHNNFTLLLAVVLSAQSTDKMVNVCTKDLFAKVSNPMDVILMGESQLIEYIKKIGLYRSKARNIMKLCDVLIDKHDGVVPDNFADLIKLSGVGRKTADVVLNSGFKKPSIAVDRHVFRVSHRMGLSFGKNTDEVGDELKKIIPQKWHSYAHHWLVLHGRYICKAPKPNCEQCHHTKWCKFFQSKNN